MSYLAFNLLLAIVWMFLTGNLSVGGFIVGFIVGFIGLAFSRHVLGSGNYIRGVAGIFRLLAVFLYELIVANLQLARDILRPVPPFKPGFISFDVRDLPPLETVLLANMISLTPGTVTVDSDDDGFTLYIHTVYAQDPEKIRQGIRNFANLIHGALGGEPYDPTQEVT
ncbi:Na+/H+ antiporter subunit E [soil metagenome]|nr:Na+/H+ antiporter subunit E [Gemmatimonadota bacterium]